LGGGSGSDPSARSGIGAERTLMPQYPAFADGRGSCQALGIGAREFCSIHLELVQN
jgi:hypothetical protein